MKALLFILLLAPVISWSQKMTPVEYNDKLVNFQNEIGYRMVDMNTELGSDGATKESVNNIRLAILDATNAGIKGASAMPAYEGNTELRDAAIELFKFYKRIVEKEYVELIDVLYSEGEITDEQAERINLIVDNISYEETAYDENFEIAQMNFADAYDIDLIENELQEVIDEE